MSIPFFLFWHTKSRNIDYVSDFFKAFLKRILQLFGSLEDFNRKKKKFAVTYSP